MSDTQQELELEIVEDQPELIYVNGTVPLFIGTVEDSVEKARNMGFQVFFVLGQEKVNGVSEPRIFKVINNLIGYAITPQPKIDLGLDELKPDAWFNLPPVPWSLAADINDFFREVHRRLGTEAIVMLTFDPIYLDDETRPEGCEPNDGWGVLVPKQTNTAGSCDYEPESIVDDKPDEVFIVGTCHSHPNMSAFCSGTDKKDQASFDGLHITYGWDKGSTKTDFHCELQLGGAFTMKPENVFSDMPKEIVNEKISPWLDRVEKKTYTTPSKPLSTVTGGGGYSGGSGSYANRGVGSTAAASGSVADEAKKRKEKYVNLPDNCPVPDKATVIAKTWQSFDELAFCPCCATPLKDEHFKKVRCAECMVYLMWNGLTLTNLIALREEAQLISLEIDPQEKPPRPIYIWEQKLSGGNLVESVACIWVGADPGKADAGSGSRSPAPGWIFCAQCGELTIDSDKFCWNCEAPIMPILQAIEGPRILSTGEIDFHRPDDDEDGFGPMDNICCNKDWKLCTCNNPLGYDETEPFIYDFCTENGIQMYSDANCADCVHQYSASCPGYRQFLKEFADTVDWMSLDDINQTNAPDGITVCSHWMGAQDFETTLMNEGM